MTDSACPTCGTVYHDGTRNPRRCRVCGGTLQYGQPIASPAHSLLPVLAATSAAFGAFAACVLFRKTR